VASFDAMGSMMFRPIGLAIAAPLSALFGIENFLYILAGVTVVAITLSFLNKEVRTDAFPEDDWVVSFTDIYFKYKIFLHYNIHKT
jgi:hypothetical protein